MVQQSYTASTTFVVPAGVTQLADLLKVGGGGGGGTGDAGSGTQAQGGGGAGGVVHNTAVTVVPGETLTITIGAGGTSPATLGNGGNGGSTSVVGSVSGALGATALGGGGGSRRAPSASAPNGEGAAGGSGGGGGASTSGSYHPLGGAGTVGQGNNGGSGVGNVSAANRCGGGGGGAGGAGGNGNTSTGVPGNGGVGVDKSATFGTGVGAAGWFGGGGGGGDHSAATVSPASGGTGGGGVGSQGTAGPLYTAAGAGVAGTGGGGGGGARSATEPGANGGSGAVVFTYTLPGPNVPTSVSNSAQTATTLDLSWSAPSGGGTVTSYEVRINGGTPVTATSPHTFTGLTSATLYTLEVRAVGPGGSSSWVSVSGTTSAVPPNVPTSVAADPTTTTIDLSWSAPSGGGTVTSYEVRLDGGTPVTATSPHTFTGLTSNTAYDVEVRAVGPGGSSSWVLVSTSTDLDGPEVAYWAKVRIGSHVWEVEYGDPADGAGPEVLAGASFSWGAPDTVGWPPPMWTVPRDVVQLRVRVPDANDVVDVHRGDVVRFSFVPEGYEYADPLVDFAGIVTGEPAMIDDPSGGVFLSVTASDYRVLLTNFTVPGETIIGVNGVTTNEDALTALSDAIDTLADGQFPGAFGDVTVGAVDPRGYLAGTLTHDVGVPADSYASALSLFASIGLVPVPVYDDDGDLDPVQPFRIVEPDPYGSDFDSGTLSASAVPNSSYQWRRDYTPTVVEDAESLTGYQWAGGTAGDLLTATLLRLSNLASFNIAGFLNEEPEASPWGPYAFAVRAWEHSESVRDWFNYPDRVRQYVTIDGIETEKNPGGTTSVSGTLKGASLVIEPRGRFVVYAGLRAHSFNVI